MVQLVHGRLTDSRSSNNETRQGSVDCSCVSCHAASAKVDREEWIRSHFWGTCTEHLREREKEGEDGRLTFTLISKEPSSPGPGAVARLCFSPYALISCLLLDLLHPPPCQHYRSRRVIIPCNKSANHNTHCNPLSAGVRGYLRLSHIVTTMPSFRTLAAGLSLLSAVAASTSCNPTEGMSHMKDHEPLS